MGNCGKAGRVALVLSTLTFATSAIAEECSEDQALLRGDWGQARFLVEVADEEAERAQGLMFRESMPKLSGMLFVYPAPKKAAFWMKNTLIPLDMIFLDKTGTVQKVHHNAEPHSEAPIYGGDNIQYVLEINGGLARQFGISPGSELLHPSIDAELAAWGC